MNLSDNFKKFMGLVEDGVSSVVGEAQAGDGASVQTQRGLLELGLHSDPELQKRYDDRKKKPVEPIREDKGLTQMEEFEKVFGKDAAARKRKEQDEELRRLIKKQ